ncbi:hypothetical protein KC901_00735 [Patescibacteria group bacterium]|nr:hypothetical protein [Patescibacteria group bacterium]
MDFNIGKYLKKNFEQQKSTTPEYVLVQILQGYIPDISVHNLSLQKSTLFIVNLSPQKKFHITLNKNNIIREAQKRNVSVHDII